MEQEKCSLESRNYVESLALQINGDPRVPQFARPRLAEAVLQLYDAV